ncbi:hypothetical protein FJQ54_11720 [Sandaracinobacter neustonicus]|uniref:Uncharacterized protein n=1 Tax=Sandaracinobacter neustonicus TaxID=1715348 RepID=A0A501XIG8_9SPHN|nr:hypothetical protein [Sandaracinobacter neustonicus]TPE60077.1 hypothetical protein FJQ54_11720 [Sandaracinobacter neustonicus]
MANGPRLDDAAPESHNNEQDDGPQAQDVAEDALNPGPELQDSRHGPSDPASLYDDEPADLVDVMREMVETGEIDTGAFEGEPMHDDEEEILGDTDPGDDELDNIEDMDSAMSDLDSDWGEDDLSADE